MTNLPTLCHRWRMAKKAEREATEDRRAIEDELIAALQVPEALEGVMNGPEIDRYQVKVTGRMNRKVDADKVQEIAAEHGLTDHLPNLFRWKPEINMSVWKATDESITKPLLKAITTTPGRPSFSIETKEQSND